MHVDYLIVGQGISGTMLSWFLYREGKSFVVIDRSLPDTASKVAAGIINPVTGRRYVYSWMIDEIMPFAGETYKSISNYLGDPFITEKSIIDFFPNPEGRENFIARLTENDTYLHAFPDQNHYNQYFRYDFGCGGIRPAYTVNLSGLIGAWRKKLEEKGALLDEPFDAERLQVQKGRVTYGELSAGKVIFCEGVAAMENPWFRLLPFSPNKGEALMIECPELTNEHIFKRGLLLAPLPEPGLFWAGSNYDWRQPDGRPTEAFRKKTEAALQEWLKPPFRVVAHRASVRPATVERRPFVGLHPQQEEVGILNGMGSKGSSLSPFFAHQLAQHLVHGFPLTPAADVQRFSRILSK